MSATGKTQAGFTLLELLVALGIMALSAGIAFPTLQSRLTRGGQEAARRDIMLALSQARADAVGHGVPTRLSFNAGALQSSSGRLPVILPPDVGVNWPDHGFVFYPDGTADGGPGEVHTASVSNRFIVDSATGRLAFSH